jgi:hypothetical protein
MNVLSIVLAAPCLAWNGQFLWTHLAELRFLAPALLLHVWLIGAVVCAIFRLVRSGAASQSVSRLQFTVLLVSGMVVFTVPAAIVAGRGWLGVDLYALAGGWALLQLLAGSVAAALVTLAIISAGTRRWGHLNQPA